jgi:aspartyl-tRNA(Asn)/glutamyl-tRNA(Gln) amidotransferase subunit B
MRSKEDAMDYRYFTEPDLPPLKVDNDFVEEIKKGLIESTYERIKRYKQEYGFSKEFINGLISNHRVNFWFEKLVELGIDPKLAAKWINMYILRYLDDKGLKNVSQIKLDKQYKDLSEDDVKMLSGKDYVEYSIWELSQLLPFDFEKFYKLLKLIQDRKIGEAQAKQVIIDMFNTGKDPEQIVEEK